MGSPRNFNLNKKKSTPIHPQKKSSQIIANLKSNAENDSRIVDKKVFKSFYSKVWANNNVDTSMVDETLRSASNANDTTGDDFSKIGSTLIKPLKREIYRNKLMPSEVTSGKNDEGFEFYITPSKKQYPEKQDISMKKFGSASTNK